MIPEAFVDRAYTPEGLLQPRTEPNALLTDADEAAARAVQMVTEGHITANDGSEIEVKAEALLVHCDTPGAVDIARKTRAALEAAGGRARSRAVTAASACAPVLRRCGERLAARPGRQPLGPPLGRRGAQRPAWRIAKWSQG